MAPLTPRLDPARLLLWGYLKSPVRSTEPDRVEVPHCSIKREVRGISREACGKVLREEGSEQNCVTQEKVGLLSTCCSGGVVGHEDAGLVSKESPTNVL